MKSPTLTFRDIVWATIRCAFWVVVAHVDALVWKARVYLKNRRM